VTLEDAIDPLSLASAITSHLARFDLIEGESDFALAFRWRGAPSYARVAALARGILAGLPRTCADGRPIYVVLDGDIAQTLGSLLKQEIGIPNDVLVLDGISLWDFDYIDLGRVRMPSFTVPVTIKSLVFGRDPRTPARGGDDTHQHPAGHHRHGPGHHHHHGAGHTHAHGHGHDPGHGQNDAEDHDARR